MFRKRNTVGMAQQARRGGRKRPRFSQGTRGQKVQRSRAGFTAAQLANVPFLRQEAQLIRQRNLRDAGFLGIELKFYDTSLAADALSVASDATGGELDPSATVLFNTVTRGDGEQQRIGNAITMKNISINGVINTAGQTNQTAMDDQPIVFLALVMDKQTNGATLASEDVYKNQAATVILNVAPYRNLLKTKRFRVLRSMQLKLEQPFSVYDGTNIEVAGTSTAFRMDVPLNIKVQYNTASTADVANITDNSLHLIGWVNNGGVAATMSYNARLRFVG